MAAIYTLAQLVSVISTEARLGADSSWPIVVKALIEEALIDAVVRDKPREFLKTRTALTLVVGEIALPTDFLIQERIEFTASGTTNWELYDERKPVCPARIEGKPASFKFAKDASTGLLSIMILFPAWVSGASDTLTLDYYFRPNVSADGDQITHERAIPSIKLAVLQRLQTLQNKPADQLAQIMQGYVLAARKDLSANDIAASTNTQET